MINNLEALDSRIPVLTQLEKQELIDKDNKIEAIKKNNGDFIQLRVDFENSSLYLKKQLHEVIKLSTNALNCTVQETNPKKEMYCWTIVASIIGDAKYWKTSMDTLVDEGDLPNQNIPGLYRTDLTWAIFNGYSQGIIAIILIPYMHDELVQSENQEAPTE